jgi:uncharacterized protein (TIGR02444 family)
VSLRAWAERAYAAPGVADLCLELQDAHGQSVCLLLWAAWAGAPAPAALARAIALSRAWEAGVVGPLRTARRALKTIGGLDAPTRAALRAQVQAGELAAERALLTALEALAPPMADRPPDPLSALAAASAAWGPPAPHAALAALAKALAAG